jgi:hypothetical protein
VGQGVCFPLLYEVIGCLSSLAHQASRPSLLKSKTTTCPRCCRPSRLQRPAAWATESSPAWPDRPWKVYVYSSLNELGTDDYHRRTVFGTELSRISSMRSMMCCGTSSSTDDHRHIADGLDRFVEHPGISAGVDHTEYLTVSHQFTSQLSYEIWILGKLYINPPHCSKSIALSAMISLPSFPQTLPYRCR